MLAQADRAAMRIVPRLKIIFSAKCELYLSPSLPLELGRMVVDIPPKQDVWGTVADVGGLSLFQRRDTPECMAQILRRAKLLSTL